MAAGRYNFTIEQGATVDFEVRYTDVSGSAIDLEGYQARMQIRPAPGAKQVYMTLSSSLGPCGSGLNMSGSVNDPDYPKPSTSGSIGVYVSALSSSQLTFLQGAVYDLEISSGSGSCYTVTRLLEGVVQLSQNITLGSF
tara:strand:+ start:39 stop:455 length:417 start_codon:yes stop_codon:yes gene_type:complete